MLEHKKQTIKMADEQLIVKATRAFYGGNQQLSGTLLSKLKLDNIVPAALADLLALLTKMPRSDQISSTVLSRVFVHVEANTIMHQDGSVVLSLVECLCREDRLHDARQLLELHL